MKITLSPTSIMVSLSGTITSSFLAINPIFIPFGKTVQKFSTKILLYIQHGISMGHLYYFEEYIFDTLEYKDIIIGGALGIIGFYRTIKRLVDETMIKTFG